MRRLRQSGCGFLLALLCACAPTLKPPQVIVETVRIDRVSSGRANATIMLNLVNPNGFDLSLNAMLANLSIEDVPFGVARLKSPLTVPAGGNTIAELGVDTDLASMLQIAAVLAQRMQEQRGASESTTVRYAVSGTATLVNGQVVPFSRQGDVSLSRNRSPR